MSRKTQMSPQRFVDLMMVVVRDNALKGTARELATPVGAIANKRRDRFRPVAKQRASANAASSIDKVIRLAVDGTLHRLYCVLDGVMAFEEPSGRGRLELTYIDNATGERVLLNDPETDELHDLFGVAVRARS